MKLNLYSKTILINLLFLCTTIGVNAQTLVSTIEAETGILTGLSLSNQSGNSSGKFVTGFDAAGDNLKLSISVITNATYKLSVFYKSQYGNKNQDFYLDGVKIASIFFPTSSSFVETTLSKVFLTAGNHTIEIVNDWGYVDIDKFNIYTNPLNSYNITPNLIDPLATVEAKNLYAYLISQFGKKIISGQTDSYFDNLKGIATKTPMLRAYDFQKYTQGYPYLWVNNAHAFGADPNASETENAINWYNNTTQKKGIINFHWHWHSPSGGTAGKNTFYTEFTNFDVRQAIISGTPENILILKDIDAIAVQLKKLQTAKIPVLWRPLHEAGGAWFWWGAKGSAASKKLYDIVYDRIVNYNDIHNLIWVWSTPESDWYPGNSKVDMIGYDSYPGAFNYTEQKNTFDQLYTIVNGQKLIAMSENGPIPDIQKCFDADAPWSYFMSWSNLVTSQNTNQHIIDVYTNPSVLTIENNTLGLWEIGSQNKNGIESIKYFPNPFKDYFTISTGSEIGEYFIYDLSGKFIEKGMSNQLIGKNLPEGTFLIKVETNQKNFEFKVIKN
jgi:mannan endo-1,4-beta-mannosidase